MENLLTIVTYEAESHTLYARQIAADAASGDLVFAGTPTDAEIRDEANGTLGAPDCGNFDDARVVWLGKPILATGQWICDKCHGVFDESEGYAEVDGGYWCESCAAADGLELDVCP